MFQNGFYISIRQTDKREVSEDVHELPPDNGPFKEYRVADYPGCPAEWSKDGTFIPVHESQPLWFDFRGNIESACLASVQRVNPATGKTANIEGGLSKDPLQNYLKLPDQLWLDGYSKDGKVYQFVIVTEGKGEAVNEVLLPKNLQDSHAMGFAFFLPKPRPKAEVYYQAVTKGTGQSGQSGMSQPMWFSPAHTPQNWRNKTSSMSSSAAKHGADLIIGSSGANARFTQNRVADNYNCVDPNDNYNCTSYDYDRAEALNGMCGIDGDMDGDMFSGIVEEVIVEEVDTSHMDKASMGAGGRIGQDIVSDNNTVEYYQEKPAAILTVYLALPEMFETITKRGKRQDASHKDAYKTSGHIGGVAVPLV